MVGAIQASEYERMASSEAGHSVHYLGPKTLEETNGIIGGAVALIHTCRPEGFGNNFLQAWLQGVPTVSLGFDPAGLIATFGLGGFARENWELFVSQVATFMDDPAAAKKIGDKAREFAEQRFSVDRTVETLESFLIEIAGDMPDARVGGTP
jgi:glycosyltransferase involved in cell wall biosynthesis